jgi:hypothetical protein
MPDLRRAVTEVNPDGLLLDATCWGAATAAEALGLPWVYAVHFCLPIPSADAPPYGIGLPPRGGWLGRLRDELARRLVLEPLGRVAIPRLNRLRRSVGLPPVDGIAGFFLRPPLLVSYTAEPFEYPRRSWPEQVRMVGPGCWDPPDPPPDWLDYIAGPLVLVTCSSEFQNDGRLVETALQAFSDRDVTLAVTTAGVDPASLRATRNAHLARFLPHAPCWPAPLASSATAAWASPRRRWQPACLCARCHSAATSSRWPGGSRSPRPAAGCPRTGYGPTGCAQRSSGRWPARPAQHGWPPRSKRPAGPRPPQTHSRSWLPVAPAGCPGPANNGVCDDHARVNTLLGRRPERRDQARQAVAAAAEQFRGAGAGPASAATSFTSKGSGSALSSFSWSGRRVSTLRRRVPQEGGALTPTALDLCYRSDVNAARISVANSSGSSQAAKWPPLSTSLK